MRKLGTLFLCAFLADGLLSTADELTGNQALGGMLTAIRQIVAWMVIFLALILYVGMVFSPRFAKRVLLLPVLFTIWVAFLGAFPLGLYVQGPLELYLCFAEAALGACVIAAFGWWETDHWEVSTTVDSRPAFSWLNLGAGTVLTAVLAVVFGMSLVQFACSAIEKQTAGYIHIGPKGIFLEERRFRKGGQEVRLVSMMHIAGQGFYDRLAADLGNTASAIVLLEGVTDYTHLLKEKYSYGHLAGLLGISSQETSSFTKRALKGLDEERAAAPGSAPPPVEYRMADVDVSTFHPQTLAFIDALGALLDSSTINDALAKLRDPNSPLRNDSAINIVQTDIITKRNEHLIGAVQAALSDHNTVVLPWGAEHMPAVQKQLEAWGFQEEKRIPHPAVLFEKGHAAAEAEN